jgi:uncharacterized lipoprotein YddW (UPF0748 family)
LQLNHPFCTISSFDMAANAMFRTGDMHAPPQSQSSTISKEETFMSQRLLLRLSIVSALFLVSGCAAFRPGGGGEKAKIAPRVEREFRGVWVATVANIDWPTKPGLSTELQKKEALAILDTVVALRLNAIVLQVRPHCDAMYESRLEPWSYYLTGVQGKAPDPYYDPLLFWVEEAHKRGLELHAWFNPYRAHIAKGGEVTDSSIIKKRPGLAKALKDGMYWLDPAKKEVQDHSYGVVMDVVRRYDIDGVHFDDYFYPYGDGSFPDDDTWAEYQKSGGSLLREDWRRAGVNAFIERVYDGIKKEKPHVKFGLSPFGIGRPGNPPSIQGFDQYSNLYADALLWLHEGWIDYWSPQLYWAINQIPQSFPVLLGGWVKENVKERHIWPGMYTVSYLRGATNEKGVDEIFNQIMIERGFVNEAPGHIHFSMKGFLKDSSTLNAGLKSGPYQKMALVPPSPWLDDEAPLVPGLETSLVNDTVVALTWSHENPADVFRWVVYYKYSNAWEYTILNSQEKSYALPLSRAVLERPRARRGEQPTVTTRVETLSNIAISAVDRTGNESGLVYQSVAPKTAQAVQ